MTLHAEERDERGLYVSCANIACSPPEYGAAMIEAMLGLRGKRAVAQSKLAAIMPVFFETAKCREDVDKYFERAPEQKGEAKR